MIKRIAGRANGLLHLVIEEVNVLYPWADKNHCHNCWDFEFDRLCDVVSSQDLPSLPVRDSSP